MDKYLYYKENDYELYKGAMQDVLSTFEKNSIDSIVCDPPYELNFMNKGWDNSGVAFQPDTWKHCYDVLKEGGYLLAFGGSRTFHRIAVAIEDAGFEIRDTIMWLYGSGFPKSQNIGLMIDKKLGVESKVVGTAFKGSSPLAGNHKGTWADGQKDGEYEIKQAQNEWSGWGTCLKPAYEPIIVARKPFKGSLVDNVIKNGVGGLNIDECRVDYNGEIPNIGGRANHTRGEGYGFKALGEECIANTQGRFPANVILTYDETDFEEVCGGFPNNEGFYRPNCKDNSYNQSSNIKFGGGNVSAQYNDSGSAARYFYCAKASKKDRDEGFDLFEEKQKPEYCLAYHNGEKRNENAVRKNIHPTVKPVDLMQYLVRLVTPKNGTILDCFMGSGSTGKAVMFENRERNANYKFIGVEMTEEYLPICQSRIDYAKNKYEYELIKEKQEQQEKGIIDIFDFI